MARKAGNDSISRRSEIGQVAISTRFQDRRALKPRTAPPLPLRACRARRRRLPGSAAKTGAKSASSRSRSSARRICSTFQAQVRRHGPSAAGRSRRRPRSVRTRRRHALTGYASNGFQSASARFPARLARTVSPGSVRGTKIGPSATPSPCAPTNLTWSSSGLSAEPDRAGTPSPSLAIPKLVVTERGVRPLVQPRMNEDEQLAQALFRMKASGSLGQSSRWPSGQGESI